MIKGNKDNENCLNKKSSSKEFSAVKGRWFDKKPWRIIPSTILGKWSIGLIIAMPLLFIIGTSFSNSFYKSTPAGDTIFEDISARPALALSMLAGMVSGIFSFISGLLAIIKQKENAVLVYISSTIGTLLVLFLAGEILFPHLIR